MNRDTIDYASPDPRPYSKHSRLAVVAFAMASVGLFASIVSCAFLIHGQWRDVAAAFGIVGFAPSMVATLLGVGSLYRGKSNLYGWWATYLSMLAWVIALVVMSETIHLS